MPDGPHTIPRPTIRDVAALAGTSLKTVSRVVNGESGVSDQLSARVRTAIDRLGYRHNLTASNLRRSGGKTRSVGMLVANVSNPLDAAVHRTIEEMASAAASLYGHRASMKTRSASGGWSKPLQSDASMD